MTDQLKRAINAAKTAQTNAEQAEAISTASSSAGEQHFDMSESTYKTSHTAIRKARRFAMQGLYEWLVTDRRFDTTGKLGWKDNAPHDIAARTRATNAMHTVHIGYYHEMMRDIPEQIESLDALINQQLDRDIDKLDTVEHAILLIGAYELQNRLEIPYKVVLDEAMKLNNHFGATDAHKLINAVLDKMAIDLRAIEVQADTTANKRTLQKAAAKQAQAPQVEVNDVNDADHSEVEAMHAVSTKPRISANKTNVKRNRPNKVNAGTSMAKATINNRVKVKEENADNPSIASVVGESVDNALSEAKNSNAENNAIKSDVLEIDDTDNSVVDNIEADNIKTDTVKNDDATDSPDSAAKSND